MQKKFDQKAGQGSDMTEITIKIVVPKESEQSSLVRVIIRVIGFTKGLLKRVEKGEDV